jgi:hypothetical protein
MGKMKITQTFRSVVDAADMDTIVLGANPSIPIPAPGDTVKWNGKYQVYCGKVASRLISYSAPELSVGRDDDFDIHVVLNVVVEDKET